MQELKKICKDSPGAPLTKTLALNAGGSGCIPGQGVRTAAEDPMYATQTQCSQINKQTFFLINKKFKRPVTFYSDYPC